MHPIRRTLLAFLALAAFAPGAGAVLEGSGNAATVSRAAKGMTAVALAVPADLELVQGPQEGLTLTGDDNILRVIQTVVEDGVLRIRFRSGEEPVRTRSRIRIRLEMRDIQGISVAGSGRITAAALAVPRLKVSLSGSGDVTLAGKAERLDANISGSGSLRAGRLETRHTWVSVAGSGDAELWARATLNASLAGSGTVRYFGDPKVDRQVAGSGSVTRAGAAPG
ncbi:MAG TPA: head GIN domain-containing protein [Usitatibacter sp.]|nr:head GIN domain-containing protein [Usitatibacter sp.]